MTAKPAEPEQKVSVLPTQKSAPSLTAATAKTLLYGPPKIGKSTLAGSIDPDHTLFLATEPGHGALEIFKIDVSSWDQFRAVGPDLQNGEHNFTTVVIDTVDELYNLCSDQVCAALGVSYPGDLEYGKGWRAVNDEFRLRVGALCSLGLGVWFISHATEIELDTRIGKITKTVPSLSSGGRKFLTGFVDYILFAAPVSDEDGERRVVWTQPSDKHEAGQRVIAGHDPLPDPLPLHGEAVRMAMAATANEKPAKPHPAPEPGEKAA